MNREQAVDELVSFWFNKLPKVTYRQWRAFEAALREKVESTEMLILMVDYEPRDDLRELLVSAGIDPTDAFVPTTATKCGTVYDRRIREVGIKQARGTWDAPIVWEDQ